MSARLFPSRRVLWLPLDFQWRPPNEPTQLCCSEMAAALEFRCEQHSDPFECPDTLLVFHEPFQEFGIPIRDGGMSYLLISVCPFCGSDLPDTGRNAWFDAVEAAGLDDMPFDKLPDRFQTAAWRRH